MHDTQAGRTCRNCDYDLRGLADDASCPECALPVRDSAFPDTLAGLDWRAARTVRIALAVFVWGTLITTLSIIGITFLYRHWHTLNPIIGAVWSRAIFRTYWPVVLIVGWSLIHLGIAMVAFAVLRTTEKWRRRAAKLLLVVLFPYMAITLTYQYGASIPLPRTPDMTIVVAPALALTLMRTTYTVLFWLLITSFVNRRVARWTWRVVLLGTAGLLLLILGSAPGWYHDAFFSFCTTMNWVDEPWQVYLPWRMSNDYSHVLPKSGTLLMCLGFLALLRLLNEARRRTRPS